MEELRELTGIELDEVVGGDSFTFSGQNLMGSVGPSGVSVSFTLPGAFGHPITTFPGEGNTQLP